MGSGEGEEEETVDLDTLRICALLHDVGKPACWAHHGEDAWKKRHTYHGHVFYGEEMISECLGEKGKAFALTARRHHNNRHYPEDCPVEDWEQIVHIADFLASAADRPEKRGSSKFPVRLSHPLSRVDAPYFVSSEIGSHELLRVDQEIRKILLAVAPLIEMDNKKAYVELYDKLSKSGMNRVPADTSLTKSDHTLWVHSNLTTTLATCIYFDGGYKGKNARYRDYKFAILAGDTDRVGKFIHKSRRLPDLVARSNMASSAIEEAVKKIKEALGPECIIYRGGGNFLALSPLSKADELRSASQEAFEKKTEKQLSVTVDYCAVNGWEFGLFPFEKPSETKGFNVLWRRVFEKVRTEKREKIPNALPDVDPAKQACDVCQQDPATIVDPRHHYFIIENGIRRPERLCSRCHALRDNEWSRGVWMEKYVDENTGLAALFKIDGDDIGEIIEGTMLEEKYGKRASPARLSSISSLIDGTCRRLGEMVERDYEGKCIYAEGDDLLGVVKASEGLKCIKELTGLFTSKMNSQATMSAGLVIIKADFPIYMALEALEQLLQNAKDYRENGTSPKMEKANIDFEAIYQVGLTKGDFELRRRVEKRSQRLSHRPCKLRDLNEVFKMLSLVEASRVKKKQASLLAAVLASDKKSGSGLPGENVKRASVVAKSLIGRRYVDPESGDFLLRSIDNGIVCDAYMLATRVYRKEVIARDRRIRRR